MTTAAHTQENGALVRQEFGAKEVARRGETSVSAAAAQAQAVVQSRYIMAMQRPRDFDQARLDLIKDCQRPKFAEKALYSRPVGGGKDVVGPSIRFTEAAVRALGNIDSQAFAIYDDDEIRIVRVVVTDLEKNVPYSKDITVQKTVERKFLKKGQIPRGQRLNSFGENVFIVDATDDEVMTKEAALVSKVTRTLQLRLIPGDLVEEAVEQIEKTLLDDLKADPDGKKKEIIAYFDSIGVKPKNLKDLLGHDLDSMSPHELSTLRKIFVAIRDGETTWAEVMEAKGKRASDEGEGSDKPKSKADQIAQDLAKKNAPAPEAKPEPEKKVETKPEPEVKEAELVEEEEGKGEPDPENPQADADLMKAVSVLQQRVKDIAGKSKAKQELFLSEATAGKVQGWDDLEKFTPERIALIEAKCDAEEASNAEDSDSSGEATAKK